MAYYSVIIPVHNEEQGIARCLYMVARCFEGSDTEVLVVDASSTDATQAIVVSEAQRWPSVTYLCAPNSGRAAQMNYGAQQAKGEVFMFVHADTNISSPTGSDLPLGKSDPSKWGYCRLSFDSKQLRFKVLAWFIRHRSKMTRVCTGDQTIVVRRQLFEQVGGFPRQPLMEDVQISKELRTDSKPKVFDLASITSPRKWQTEGYVRTILLMWSLRLRYFLGSDAKVLYTRYYRK